jgi:hypothetical protein
MSSLSNETHWSSSGESLTNGQRWEGNLWSPTWAFLILFRWLSQRTTHWRSFLDEFFMLYYTRQLLLPRARTAAQRAPRWRQNRKRTESCPLSHGTWKYGHQLDARLEVKLTDSGSGDHDLSSLFYFKAKNGKKSSGGKSTCRLFIEWS